MIFFSHSLPDINCKKHFQPLSPKKAPQPFLFFYFYFYLILFLFSFTVISFIFLFFFILFLFLFFYFTQFPVEILSTPSSMEVSKLFEKPLEKKNNKKKNKKIRNLPITLHEICFKVFFGKLKINSTFFKKN